MRKNKSNFDYKFDIRFNTDYYKQSYASFESVGDEASYWRRNKLSLKPVMLYEAAVTICVV